MTTLEQELNTVSKLPIEYQKMLIEIIQNPLITNRRQEIAEDAEKAISSFHKGELKPQTIDEIIAELQKTFEVN
ncbi:MAG: hypothetical protein QNJ70_07665 [Xenococcaceae cyanobacterium MO_207.B15]|nr:hypothetical protein [Xenococcaceae cyanobacterium MO_207.B15]